MINDSALLIPHGYKGFAIDSKNSKDIESIAILSTASINNIPFKIVKGAKHYKQDIDFKSYIPIGDIDFIQDILGKKIKPNYYPEYLKDYLKRKVWETDKWPLGNIVFIKPSDVYKRFTGFITNGGYRGKKRGPYICSEVIKIKNEWRYYICKGVVLFANWYTGEMEKDAPKLDIKFDNELCCCLDMGELEDGDIVLIEQQDAFSCGWYGKSTVDNNAIYTKWLAYGWDYIVRFYGYI